MVPWIDYLSRRNWQTKKRVLKNLDLFLKYWVTRVLSPWVRLVALWRDGVSGFSGFVGEQKQSSCWVSAMPLSPDEFTCAKTIGLIIYTSFLQGLVEFDPLSLTTHSFWIYLLFVICFRKSELFSMHVFLHAIFAERAFVGRFVQELYVHG